MPQHPYGQVVLQLSWGFEDTGVSNASGGLWGRGLTTSPWLGEETALLRLLQATTSFIPGNDQRGVEMETGEEQRGRRGSLA